MDTIFRFIFLWSPILFFLTITFIKLMSKHLYSTASNIIFFCQTWDGLMGWIYIFMRQKITITDKVIINTDQNLPYALFIHEEMIFTCRFYFLTWIKHIKKLNYLFSREFDGIYNWNYATYFEQLKKWVTIYSKAFTLTTDNWQNLW